MMKKMMMIYGER